MKKKTLLLVIILMSLSLIGLIGFQAYWIHHAVQMEEEVFDRNVNDALHQVVRRMETQEALLFLKEEAPQLRKAALSTDYTVAIKEKDAKPKTSGSQRKKSNLIPTAVDHPKGNAPLKQGITYGITYVESTSGQPSSSFRSASAPVSGSAVTISGTPVVSHARGHGGSTRVIFRTPAGDSMFSGPKDQIHYQKEGQRIANDVKFGKSKLDSVVIWRLLAAQSRGMDSAKAFRARGLTSLRIDTSLVQRLALDTMLASRKLEVLNQVPSNRIKSIHINGKVMNIFTDTLVMLEPSKAFYPPLDSGRQHFYRYIPEERRVSKARTIEHGATVGRQRPSVPLVQPDPVPAQAKITQEQVSAQKAEAKAQHLNQVMEKMAAEYVRKEKPLQQRLQELDLNQMVAEELKNRNIYTPYHLQVKSDEEPSFLLTSNNPALSQPVGVYQAQLFPNDVLTMPSYVQLNFPDRNAVVWQGLLVPTFISGLFTLIILLTFSFTLFTILRQKKISEIRNDFINNMTHEFKTPIATISLALDALVNPKVRKDEVRVDYYASIIKDENRRMHQQVEKVLQTAQMERNNLQLAIEPVDVHALIRKAAEPFQLHIEQRQGAVQLKLDAENPIIWADRSHLANMIGNLLDNANKYSPEAPKITIQTAVISKGLHISVEDQGAGMSREAQKRVFEKFYRVPTGNVHNVKGFGLGLSYVKTMAQAHAGTIHLRSELGRGSKFTLWLPVQKAQPHA